jgi:branched-chain amino acid aminotransferase
MDGALVDWNDATTHVLSHGLHYGTGAFEGIRAYKTPRGVAVFRLREHMARLLRSCKILMIDVPFSLDELCDAVVETVRVNDLANGCYIRPLVYLGYGEMGVNPLPAPVKVAIAAWPWGAYLGDEVPPPVQVVAEVISVGQERGVRRAPLLNRARGPL